MEELIKFGLALALAFLLGRDRRSMMPGGLISGLIGGSAIVTYFISCLLIQTGAELIIANKFERGFSELDVMAIVTAKSQALACGMLLAVGVSWLGWKGLGTGATIGIVLCILLIKFGINLKFWGLLAVVSLLVWAAQLTGAPNAALCAVVLLSGLGTERQLVVKERVQLDNLGTEPSAWVLGFASGVIPAINEGLFLHRSTDLWWASSLASGFSIGINLFQRDASKSAVGTIMSQFAPTLNPIVGVAAIGFCLWFLTLPGSIKFIARPIELPNWFITVANLLTAAWYISIPEQPLATLLVVGISSGLIKVLAKVSKSWMPETYQFGLGAAPILFL